MNTNSDTQSVPYLEVPSTLNLIRQLNPSQQKNWLINSAKYFGLPLLFSIFILAWGIVAKYHSQARKTTATLAILSALSLLAYIVQQAIIFAGDFRDLFVIPDQTYSSQLDKEIETEKKLIVRLQGLHGYELRRLKKRIKLEIQIRKKIFFAYMTLPIIAAFAPLFNSSLLKDQHGHLTQFGLYFCPLYAGLVLGLIILPRVLHKLRRLHYVLKEAEEEHKRLAKLSS